uniref:NnrU family protein n=1 Tax=Stappia sp. TaxID=1870903 RepID=UPI003BABE72D
MTEFLASLAAFLAAHAIPPHPRVRPRLIAAFGRRTYLAAYSLLSLVLLVWLISAASRAPYVMLWEPAAWQAHLALTFMPLAAWLLIAGLSEPTPLSVSLMAPPDPADDWRPGPAASVVRHPVLAGFLLWALLHLVANGHLVALILFGTFAALSLGGMALLDLRARRRLGPDLWHRLAGRTSRVPFVALVSGRARPAFGRRDLAILALTLALFAWFLLQGHLWLIGRDPLARF